MLKYTFSKKKWKHLCIDVLLNTCVIEKTICFTIQSFPAQESQHAGTPILNKYFCMNYTVNLLYSSC